MKLKIMSVVALILVVITGCQREPQTIDSLGPQQEMELPDFLPGAGGWLYTYDITTPMGSDSPTILDDRIREVKLSVEERLDADHYFHKEDGTTNQVDAADTGKHRQITFHEPIATPGSVDANEGILYIKTVNGLSELHWIDMNENNVQITSAGTILVADDAINQDKIELDNDEWLVASNAAGTADANIVKVNSSNVVVLAVNAELQSGIDASDSNEAIANKKYVDDEIAGLAFGSWTSKAKDTTYEASTRGIVTAYVTAGITGQWWTIKGLTDADNPPTTIRNSAYAYTPATGGIVFPVKKGDYWKITTTNVSTATVYWLPIGG